MKLKHITFRIPEDVLNKYKYVSQYYGRSMNAQVLMYMKGSISAFEKEHGKIPADTKIN